MGNGAGYSSGTALAAPYKSQSACKLSSLPLVITKMVLAVSSQTRVWEGRGSVLGYPLVTVESDSGCAHPTALWTVEGMG